MRTAHVTRWEALPGGSLCFDGLRPKVHRMHSASSQPTMWRPPSAEDGPPIGMLLSIRFHLGHRRCALSSQVTA